MELSESLVKTIISWIEVFMRHSMRNFLLYSKQNGFSMTQIATLFMIHRKGTSCVSEIGDELTITSPAASQLLERLFQQGLILRSEDPANRRMKQIVLTDKGRQVLQESIDARQSWFVDLASTLSESEKEQVVAALRILIDKANQLDKNPNRTLSDLRSGG